MANLRAWNKLASIVVTGGLMLFSLIAYFYTAPVADGGDTYIGPAIAHAALRSLIIAQILKAFYQRWNEFTTMARIGWVFVAIGIIFNLARGLFSDTPLTLSYLFFHTGLIIITWRLMTITPREKRLARSLHESEEIRLQQDEVIQDKDVEIQRIGMQAKHYEMMYNTLIDKYGIDETELLGGPSKS